MEITAKAQRQDVSKLKADITEARNAAVRRAQERDPKVRESIRELAIIASFAAISDELGQKEKAEIVRGCALAIADTGNARPAYPVVSKNVQEAVTRIKWAMRDARLQSDQFVQEALDIAVMSVARKQKGAKPPARDIEAMEAAAAEWKYGEFRDRFGKPKSIEEMPEVIGWIKAEIGQFHSKKTRAKLEEIIRKDIGKGGD